MLGNYGTLAVNINDFTRYAKNTRTTYVQLFMIPASFVVMAFCGMLIAGGAEEIYGERIWDPLTIMGRWTGTSRSRAGAAFCGLAFAIAQAGTNLGANCISGASDLNALFPKYINLRRGSFLIAFVGAWVLTPWNILSSAEALLNFMSGYTIWVSPSFTFLQLSTLLMRNSTTYCVQLAPITGIILADFYFVRGQTYEVPELYLPTGQYRYNKYGTNWRAAVAWFLGWVPLLGGFASAVNPSLSISTGALHLYYLGYIYGFSFSFFVYIGLSKVFPPEAVVKHDDMFYGTHERQVSDV